MATAQQVPRRSSVAIATLLVPVDETEEAERAIPVAVALAEAAGAVLELVTVDSPHVDAFDTRCYHNGLIARLPVSVRARGTVSLTDDDVAAELDRLCGLRPGALICLSSRVRGSLGELVLGSTSDAVIRTTRHPVLLVGPSCEPERAALTTTWGPAVAAVDGSDLDADVVAAAVNWSQSVGTDVVLAHAVYNPGAIGAIEDGRELLEHRRHEVEAHGLAASSKLLVAGDPGRAILRLVDERAGILIVGSHRRGPIGRIALGTNALWLAHRAQCPVLVAGRSGQSSSESNEGSTP